MNSAQRSQRSDSNSVKPAGLTPALTLEVPDALELLARGALSVEGRLVQSSNGTLYCAATAEGVSAACVYKPVAWERPLWDFPDGTLAEREVAAFAVSAATGWNIVPPSVLRDGPAGPGMVQLWIDEDESVDRLELMRRRADPQLRRIAVLDAVINNADRKGGHLLATPNGHIYGVDHGVCFNAEDKLRTVLWQWADEKLTAEASTVLQALRVELGSALGERLSELLTVAEVQRTAERVDELLAAGKHPTPSGNWPPVPWPPI